MAMSNNDFCVFIISHGRPDKLLTLRSLERAGYTGKTFIVIDNEDEKSELYYKNFGEIVQMFDKAAIAKTTDQGDNFHNRRTTTHARNACFDIAEKLGYTYFLVLDDDYTNFYFTSDPEFKYRSDHKPIRKIDNVFDIYLDYFKTIPAFSIAFAQGGDFIGGPGSNIWKKKLSRKCMNSWFCSTERRFKFISRLNEDVNTYVANGVRGNLFFTTCDIRLEQVQTQANAGGMTEAYVDGGTYVKSFYTVMYHPSGTKISTMGVEYRRIHHNVIWRNTVPVIIDEKYKKQ